MICYVAIYVYICCVAIYVYIMLQYMHIFFESQVVARGVKTVREFSVYAELRVVNGDISLSLLPVYFICVDGMDRSCYVPRQEPMYWRLGVYVCVRVALQLAPF
jgi:hypothetical protein